ncbi:type II toxin-antitoxin system RelE family toxin [Methanolacinia paynteri]|uniref:type II toxin-antitoxin system RelE family toxin n=1 Tax=Methanolacinia paynteri TaxID=230356 RepID=UPI00064F90B3|nr:type II toxin-antitoxin system RelE/ParE family toxin [Methanolacinia paynteri]
MTWEIILTPGAERDLKRLPKVDGKRIVDELTDLANEPYPRSYVKKLKGHKSMPLYSYRVGQYRIIMTIEDNVMVLFIIEIGGRGKIYRKY